jgi:hypothetical protein
MLRTEEEVPSPCATKVVVQASTIVEPPRSVRSTLACLNISGEAHVRLQVYGPVNAGNRPRELPPR